jgi:transposase-like protein
MARRHRSFTKEFKTNVLREIDAGLTSAQAARQFEVHPETVRQWRSRQRKYGDHAFAGQDNAYADDVHVAEFERTIGQLTLENRFLKTQRRLKGRRPQERRAAMVALIREKCTQAHHLSVERLCRLAGIRYGIAHV